MAVSPDGTRAYVANQFFGTVSVIDTATNTVTATITVGDRPVRGGGQSGWHPRLRHQRYLERGVGDQHGDQHGDRGDHRRRPPATAWRSAPDGTRAYVTNFNSNTVSVINTATNTVIATIPVGSGPQGVAVSPDSTRAYVTNFNSNTVSVINTATNTVIAMTPVGSAPSGVAVAEIDSIAPSVTLVTPAQGAVYSILDNPVADYSCADPGGSGLASCTGTLPDGAPVPHGLSQLGQHTFTVTATDNAGNSTTVSHTYRVTLLGLGIGPL